MRIQKATSSVLKTTTKNNVPERITVGILDSGAGGLCIAKEIHARKLNTNIIYIADKAFFPYGQLSDESLVKRLVELVQTAQNDFGIDIFIIACNTASTLALNELRSRYKTPFIGVVPAIKPASENSQTGFLSVLATKATVQRQYLFDLIRRFASDKNVRLHGSSILVDLAENYVLKNSLDEKQLTTEILKAFYDAPSDMSDNSSRVDQLVLACTHFPILLEQIKKVLSIKGLNANVIDSTCAIVNRLEVITQSINAAQTAGKNYDTNKNAEKLNIIVSTSSETLESYVSYLCEECEYESNYKLIDSYPIDNYPNKAQN